jgi:hypothetical protein
VNELFLAGGGQTVEFGTLAIFGNAPFCCDPPFSLQTVQGRIEAAMVDLQEIIGLGANCLPDPMTVLWTPLERPQDQKIQGALQYFEFFRHVEDILPLL